METLSVVRDLILDFAQKIADAKCQGNLNQSIVDIKKDFVSKMMAIRGQMPSYLYINYNQNITEEEAKEVFDNIKSFALSNYVLGIPLPQYSPIIIDGIKLEIPVVSAATFYDKEEVKGLFVLDYDTNENKIASLNQTLLQILLTLPIKKILLNLVDLKAKYEYEFLLQNLPPQIYNEAPITSEEQLLRLLDRLEKRKQEVITKYDVFMEYCAQHETFPMPYEFVVLYDEVYDEVIRKRLNALIEDSVRIGVFFILPKKASKVLYGISEPYVFSPNNKEIYTLNIPEYIKNGSDAQYTGLTFMWYDRDADVDMLADSQNRPDDSWILTGTGDFEVRLEGGRSSRDYGFLLQNARRNNGLLGLFQTEQDALNYMRDFCMKYNIPQICLYPHYLEIEIESVDHFFSSDTYKIGLSIEKWIIENHKEELEFYLTQLGLSKGMKERIISILEGEIYPDEYGKYGKEKGTSYDCTFYYWKDFSSKDEVYVYFNQLFSQIDNKAQQMWGGNYKFSHLYFCLKDRTKWSEFGNKIPQDYVERDCGLGDLHLVVEKKAHISIPVEYFETPANDGLINFTPITNNPTLLKACFDYIRTETDAKEEMKVQNWDFGSAAESKYETDLSTMIIPVGKAESKDVDFRMDLVSHVHSFIIGQSGSGKSVFLHNIIGGAMLKYAPEDLQLYLLDFKLGGVEFNRYKGAKHVKALLVDNSDPQVTLEILRELRGSMSERGKLLRSAGVNNIGEYNKLHQQDRMPHVLVVADECHEMFKADDSIPRQVRNEISDIVIKIAKEGRSQGVHLVFATQTLSGTEISSEIINNVSDFYLLKCAQTDSERLVPNSSAITSELSTGQIYYHHVDEQVKFQAYYTDKEAAEKLMAAIVEKAKDHKSNGEFYFNGAQMFYLDEAVKEQMQAVKGKSPVAFMGKAIDISQKDLYIKLNEDFSENVLLLGLNDQEQVTRTTMNLFVSLMMSAKLKHKDIAFKVIDCLNNEEGEVHELIFDLENEGYCEIIERRQRSKFFKELAQGVQDGTAEETILLILGQDRFRELKMDMELEESNSCQSSDDEDMNILSDNLFGDSSSSSTSVRTYRDALNVILDKGPDYGVHTLLQIEKASNLLFEDYITPKVVFQKFKHLVMLKSDETAGVTLHLNDDIRLEKLSSDWERLRAYYYAEESDSYTLFTPYMPSKSKDIINLLK